MPTEAFTLCEVATHERSEKPTGVDAHVEQREARVASRIAHGIQLADHRRHVRFKEPGSNDDEPQSGVERLHAGECKYKVAR